jgi:ribosomal protein L12E/L44/L45/RPP1/RPP2
METKVIVLIADRGDPKHGEIAIVDDTADAERLIETLIEAGFDGEQVRVFSGSEMVAQVSQRPKVDIVCREESEPAPAAEAAAHAEAPADEDDAQPEEPAAEAEAPVQEENAEEPVSPRNGGFALFRHRPAPAVELMPELLH